MTHSYSNIPKFSQTGMPTSEFARLQGIINMVTRNDWTSSRRKSKEERLTLTNAKLAYGKASRSPYFPEYRGELVKEFLKYNVPNFGSFKFTIV